MTDNFKNTHLQTIMPWLQILFKLCILFAASTNLSIAEKNTYEWQLEKDADDIKVYVIAVENTDIIKSKSVATIHFPIEKIKEILDDIEHRHEWVPFLKASSVLKQNSGNKKIEYSIFSAPWPVSDRDFVYSLQRTVSTGEQQIYEMKSVKNSTMPENNNRVRGEIFESKYILTAINNNATRVELIYHADPKGWLPNWIINIIQKVLPYKILKNLRARLRLQTTSSAQHRHAIITPTSTQKN